MMAVDSAAEPSHSGSVALLARSLHRLVGLGGVEEKIKFRILFYAFDFD